MFKPLLLKINLYTWEIKVNDLENMAGIVIIYSKWHKILRPYLRRRHFANSKTILALWKIKS